MIGNDTNTSISFNLLGLPSILTIVFVVLKLTDHIDWAWCWILSPLWISVLIALFFVIIGVLIAILQD